MTRPFDVPHPTQLDQMAHQAFRSLVHAVVIAHHGHLVLGLRPDTAVELLRQVPPGDPLGPAAAFLITVAHGEQADVMQSFADMIRDGLLAVPDSAERWPQLGSGRVQP